MEFSRRTSASVSLVFGSAEKAVLISVAAEEQVSVSRTMMLRMSAVGGATVRPGLLAVGGSTGILRVYPPNPKRKAVLVALVL
jgi:hypothetical protein